jgi:hypothetical protein
MFSRSGCHISRQLCKQGLLVRSKQVLVGMHTKKCEDCLHMSHLELLLKCGLVTANEGSQP